MPQPAQQIPAGRGTRQAEAGPAQQQMILEKPDRTGGKQQQVGNGKQPQRDRGADFRDATDHGAAFLNSRIIGGGANYANCTCDRPMFVD